MMALWSSLAFVSPWMLLALFVLPVLWWLLRATPPAPKKVGFPAISLVRGLQPKEVVADKTPWWLLLLRMMIVAALIVAFAGPLMSPETNQRENQLLLLVDDTAQAATNWQVRELRLQSLLAQAERKNRNVFLVTTANDLPEIVGPMPAAAARNLVQAMQPKALYANRAGLLDALSQAEDVLGDEDLEVVWLSDGLANNSSTVDADLEQALADLGGNLTVFQVGEDQSGETADALTNQVALRLLPPVRDGREIKLTIERAEIRSLVQPVRLFGTDIDGKLVVEKDVQIDSGQKSVEVTLDLPRQVRNRLFRLEISQDFSGVQSSQSSVQAVQLMDDRWQSRSIGLISARRGIEQAVGGNQQTNRFLSATFYIETALDSFADVAVGGVEELIAQPRSVLFWPDAAQLGEAELETLEDWVEAGGTLVRFAGPNLARSTLTNNDAKDPLLPVALRVGDRTLGGALDWTQAANIASFSPIGSFADLAVSNEIEIKRQVLAQPSLDIEQKTWATLVDGTPLVTATMKGDGRLVFFHTTASPRWSNLSLSGLFVEMLQKIVLDSSASSQQAVTTNLKPSSLLDAFGRSRGPVGSDQQISAANLAAQIVGAANAPGLYGNQSEKRALNFSQPDRPFNTLKLQSVTPLPYAGSIEYSLKPWFLIGAFVALLLDFLIRIFMSGGFQFLRFGSKVASVALLLGLVSIGSIHVEAQETSTESKQEFRQRQAILETRLGFVRTGNSRIDATSRAGLYGLTQWITRRSSIELGTPTGIDLAKDELIFHPVVYWPVAADQKPLPEEIAAKINDYMAAGGLMLIDTRDAGFANGNEGNRNLIRALRGLSVPPLVPISDTHVLTKSFYLTNWFPGRWANGQLWVAANATSDEEAGVVNDGVAPVVVGSADWASAWAVDDTGTPMFPVVPGINRQREFAYRFGTNLVMYALAGNYKADQVHVKSILERLTPKKAGAN